MCGGAEKVNARDVLLRRARTCERIRHHFPNLLAVDFFKTGDLNAVVDEMNGVGPAKGSGQQP